MENFKTVEHRARRIGATITLEVGDRGTIMHDGRMLASFVMDRRHGYCYCRLPGAGFPGLLPVHRLVA